MQVHSSTSPSFLPSPIHQTQQLAQKTFLSPPASAMAGSASNFSVVEKSAIFDATGGVIGDDGVVDFSVGVAAGKNSGKIPEGMTHVSVAFEFGTVDWYGAAGPSASADGPGQNADLPQGTLTGMRLTMAPGANSEQRNTLITMALGYVNALNTGESSSWAPHAIFDVKVGH
jgi:hypothetical protein